MFRKFILFLLGIVLFFPFHPTYASAIINEIMYDLDGSDIDWVEIYNPDNADVDLTALKLLISNSTSNHGIVKYSGSAVLHQGEYGIIVATSQISSFITKWGNSGNIFNSSFSLPNDTAKVEINAGDKNIPTSSVTYTSGQGATEDGKSLALLSGAWVASTPTPSAMNQASAQTESNSNPTPGDINENNDTGNGTDTGTTMGSSNSLIKLKILAKFFALVGVPLEFQAQAFGYKGEQLPYGKFFWNFGDGDSKESMNSLNFTHTYFYPGEYSVSLEYYTNSYADTPDAVTKIMIKVVPMTILISKVGDENDFFIELSNNSDYEIDISKWVLSSEYFSFEKKFILPKNTVILAKKKIILPSGVTGFTFEYAKNLKLNTTEGQLVFDYGNSLTSTPVTVPKKNNLVLAKATPNDEPTVLEKINANAQNDGEQILSKDLSAVPILGEDSSKDRAYLPIFVLIIIILVGTGATYFIRQKKTVANGGEDFKILN